MRFFEDLEVGQRRELGSYTFTADEIKAFARQFDPQRFHLDEEAGRNSLFGGLAASGWHVGSVCMKLLVAKGQQEIAGQLQGSQTAFRRNGHFVSGREQGERTEDPSQQ